MFQTFTGSSRKRQVNLSGRPTNTNPFGSSPFGTSHNTLLGAQQDREKRQKDRERLEATKKIQKTWRGYRSRKNLRAEWRSSFDAVEGIDFEAADASILSNAQPYGNDAEALAQLRLLMRFAQPRNNKDVLRIAVFSNRQAQATPSKELYWGFAYLRLQKLIISTLEIRFKIDKASKTWQILLKCLAWNVEQIPEQSSKHAKQLYGILARYLDENLRSGTQFELNPVLTCLLRPLQTGKPTSPLCYEAFCCKILTLTSLAEQAESITWLDTVANRTNYKVMARTLVDTLDSPTYHDYSELQDIKRRGNLLGFLIYFHQSAINGQPGYSYSTDKDYLHVVSTLITSLVPSVPMSSEEEDDEGNSLGIEDAIRDVPFVKTQVTSLVSKANVSLILGSGNRGDSNITAFSQRDESAKQLANFSLTLLKFFPSRSDDIRVSLYLGSGADPSNPSVSVPALKYFWQSAQATNVFGSILQNTDSAVPLLQVRKPLSSAQGNIDVAGGVLSLDSVQSDWRVLLIFFELYLFALKIMDDEEFFSSQSITKVNKIETWASQNALPLEDIALFTLFLKNLGFSLYFNAAKISAVEKSKDRTAGSLSGYFGLSSSIDEIAMDKSDVAFVAGLNGITVEYVKGLVTGLLRALYERDSRRPFLPKDHWLMTSKFDMESFIPAVVKEEENRHEIEEDDEPLDIDPLPTLIGQSHASRLRAVERLKQQQRKLARQRQLQAVAPRLEILQNMPFFIPFETRVQIFREFIALDKFNRRGGLDADTWRLSTRLHAPNEIGRHHARVRRDHIFEDAFKQFEKLGSGLKEPIQITFVNNFGQEEAGIDGGGVTKEFLTSITSEAFKANTQPPMFVENAQNLLYPNPSSLDEIKWRVTDVFGFSADSEKAREAIKSSMSRYEFLGRIIGKCMYEGILVDVSFAGFFLLKWALTGGAGQARRESGYRANLNDLRELDEDLYNGLLKLKNDPGDVSEYSLDFTIADTITTNYERGTTKSFIRPLKYDGANIPVTNENRLVYISCVAHHRLQVQPRDQTMAFLGGLASIIQPSWLSMFNQHELQTLIGGTSRAIDVSDLRKHTIYGGLYVIGDDGLEHPTVKMFWDVMNTLDDTQRRAVLKFVTSTPRAPLLGFESLNPAFSIRDGGTDETRLPSTSTCVNLLKLPRYSSEQLLKEKLLTAVNAGAGFDLS